MFEEWQGSRLPVPVAKSELRPGSEGPTSKQGHGEVSLGVVNDLVELKIAPGYRHLEGQGLRSATGGKETAIQGGAVPGEIELEIQRRVAVLDNELGDLLSRRETFGDFGVLDDAAEVDALGFADGKTERDPPSVGIGGVPGYVPRVVIEPAGKEVETPADAVQGVVRIEVVEADGLLEVGVTDAEPEAVPGAENVVLLVVAADDQTVSLGVAERGRNAPRRLLFHRELHIDLIVSPRDLRRLYADPLEVAEPLEPDLGEVDLRRRGPASFHLPHLSAHHLVLGDLVAGKGNSAHVGPLAGIHVEHHLHRAVLADARHPRGRCEGVTRIAEGLGEPLLRRGDERLRENLPLGHEKQALEVLGVHVAELTDEVDAADRVLTPFFYVHRDVNLAPVRRDAHLSRLDIELHVAAIAVIRLQRLEVGRELLPSVLVVVPVEREKARVL